MSERLERIRSRRSMNGAYVLVRSGKGSGGTDGMELGEPDGSVRENWPGIKEQIRERKYAPKPVLRVEIPKPNEGRRKPGIPTVMDRVSRLNAEIRGWMNQFAQAQMKTAMADLDAHLRTRCRMCIWKQWKVPAGRQRGLKMPGEEQRPCKADSACGGTLRVCGGQDMGNQSGLKEETGTGGRVGCLQYCLERHDLKLR